MLCVTSMLLLLFISWFQILQVYTNLAAPGNNLLKLLFLPFVAIFSLMNIVFGIIDVLYPNYVLLLFNLFVYIVSAIGFITISFLSLAGFKIYFILKRSIAINGNRIVKKISFFVFATIALLLVSVIGLGCMFIVAESNASGLLLGITIVVILFIMINGLGISWVENDGSSSDTTLSATS